MIYSEKDKFMVAINCDSSDIIPYVTITHKDFPITYSDENKQFWEKLEVNLAKAVLKTLKEAKDLK